MPKEHTFNGDDDFLMRLYANDALQHDLLTPEQETVLAGRIAMGDDEARETMICSNLKFVVSLAGDYLGYGLPLPDLINEGNIGLMRAVEKFDPTKGAKLSTYASWWIKQSIKRALANQGKTIRIPVHLVTLHGRLNKISKILSAELGREPTFQEIADEADLSLEKVEKVMALSTACSSLDSPVSDDGSDTIKDVVADASAVMPFDGIASSSVFDLAIEYFGGLEYREREILTMRFGLNGEDIKTLDEIGKRFGVTRERIRQVQNKALAKIRAKMEKGDVVPDPEFAEFIGIK